jgi:uncharacterized protein YcbK (DUF882 family)
MAKLEPGNGSERRRLLGCACCAVGGLIAPVWAGASTGAAATGSGAPAASPRKAASGTGSAGVEDWRVRLLQGPRSLWLARGEAQVRSTYWTPDAGYDGDAYKEICWLLRDVQANKSFAMSLRLLDVLCGLQNWFAFNGLRQPILVNSGYRTFATNYRTEGAALNSQHLLGRAADITVPGVPVGRLAAMASLFGQGGVGMYVRQGFVHVDTGDERIWIK